MQKNNKNAFTLLELLVVISIIGILITLGATAYSTAQKKGRDAKRKSDIKTMQNGFEEYYSKNTLYPTTTTLAGSDNTIFPSGLPTDPKNSGNYVYTYGLGSTSYCICSLLENSTGNASALPSGTTCSFGTGSYYCLSSLQ